MKNIIITIDGPAASGKEKISKYISRKWGLKHLDSGILYRRLALILSKDKVNFKNINAIKKKINKINNISYRKNSEIRSQKISKLASKIAVYNFVREFINSLQYDFVKKNKKDNGFVIDGRDIGSVVFKKADLKLYIDVKPEIRAKRRYKQLIDSGEKSIYPKILKEIKLRDQKDKNRKHSPLVVPKNAFIIHNNGIFKETTDKINKLISNI
ncbi:(d)CMP kinase [Pelagibacteraceae bacterium]|nr:(d)CMP kinase [Pelagibacteraceae bacterium]